MEEEPQVGSMDLSAALWSELPSEILDDVLSFLPVQDLCRYRTVCKRWDQLVCNPKFGAVCTGNASKRDASLIAMRYKYLLERASGSRTAFGWCLFDLNAWRWYMVEEAPEIPRDYYHVGVDLGEVMDGGLFCKVWTIDLDGYGIVVYNPMAKTWRNLPIVPEHLTSQSPPLLTMVVDSISQSFKVFVIYHICHAKALDDPSTSLEEPCMRVYDSATNVWRSFSTPSCVPASGVGPASSVMFQGLLYVYLPSFGEEDPLWRYNLVEDEWENLPVVIPDYLHDPELIASANRLFLVAFRYGNDDEIPWLLEASELKFPDLTREMLLEMSAADFVRETDLKTGIDKPLLGEPNLKVVGFGPSLLFMSQSTEMSAVFHLATRSWGHGLPPIGFPEPRRYCGWVGKHMNVILPCTALW